MTDFTPNNFWHMQMHPEGKRELTKYIPYILEHRGFIGLGHWLTDGKPNGQIIDFQKEMQVNDIVAIRDGKTFIALVQVIGGVYHIEHDKDEFTNWIKHRRPVRVLDWEIDGQDFRHCPDYRPTLRRCEDDEALTTKAIKDWYHKVAKSLMARELPLSV